MPLGIRTPDVLRLRHVMTLQGFAAMQQCRSPERPNMTDAFSPVSKVPSTDGVSLTLHDLGGPETAELVSCRPRHRVLRSYVCTVCAMSPELPRHRPRLQGPRGHTAPLILSHRLVEFGADALATAVHLAGESATGLLGFGHSMGGAALLMAEILQPGTFRAIYVYEPILAPEREDTQAETPLAASARRRRDQFPSYEQALENFRTKPPLSSFQNAVLELYVNHGFRQETDGIHLKCRREDEAQIFANAGYGDAFERLGEVECPVWVARGLKHGESGATRLAAPVAQTLPRSELIDFPDLGHLSPFEVPEMMAADVSRRFAST